MQSFNALFFLFVRKNASLSVGCPLRRQMFLASWVARPVRSAFGTALYDASQVNVKNEGTPHRMVYSGSLALSVAIPLRAALVCHRIQQVIHHLCRSGRGALDGVGIDFGGGS